MKKTHVMFIDSCRWMLYVLVRLTSNLVGVNDMKFNICKNSCKINHINENYVVHEKCEK